MSAIRKYLQWMYGDQAMWRGMNLFDAGDVFIKNRGIFPFVRQVEILWDFDKIGKVQVRSLRGCGWSRSNVYTGNINAQIKTSGCKYKVAISGQNILLHGVVATHWFKNLKIITLSGPGIQLTVFSKLGNNSPEHDGMWLNYVCDGGGLKIDGPQLLSRKSMYSVRSNYIYSGEPSKDGGEALYTPNTADIFICVVGIVLITLLRGQDV